MKRFGLEPEQAFNFAEKISKLKNIRLRGILSHFSTSEEEDESFAKLQLQRFKEVVKKVEPFYDHNLIKSIANSGAVLKLPDSYFNQVRVGILLYGIYPSREVSPTIKIKPVMSLKSKIVTLKSVEKNTPVGYGRGFITKRKTTVGIIPLGYADGYSRLLSNRGEVLVKGKKAKIIGRVCMDAFMIDVTDVPRVKIGDEAVLVGKQGKEQISIDDISKWSEIFSYEVISRMGKRLPKVFVQNI
jgi:alanine racemase